MRKVKKALLIRYIIFMIVLVISLVGLLVSVRTYSQLDELKRNSKIVILDEDGTLRAHIDF